MTTRAISDSDSADAVNFEHLLMVLDPNSNDPISQAIKDVVSIRRVAALPEGSDDTLRTMYITPDGSQHWFEKLRIQNQAAVPSDPDWQELSREAGRSNGFGNDWEGPYSTVAAFRASNPINDDTAYVYASHSFQKAVDVPFTGIDIEHIPASEALPAGWTYIGEFLTQDEAKAHLVLGRNVANILDGTGLSFSVAITTAPTFGDEFRKHKMATLEDLQATADRLGTAVSSTVRGREIAVSSVLPTATQTTNSDIAGNNLSWTLAPTAGEIWTPGTGAQDHELYEFPEADHGAALGIIAVSEVDGEEIDSIFIPYGGRINSILILSKTQARQLWFNTIEDSGHGIAGKGTAWRIALRGAGTSIPANTRIRVYYGVASHVLEGDALGELIATSSVLPTAMKANNSDFSSTENTWTKNTSSGKVFIFSSIRVVFARDAIAKDAIGIWAVAKRNGVETDRQFIPWYVTETVSVARRLLRFEDNDGIIQVTADMRDGTGSGFNGDVYSIRLQGKNDGLPSGCTVELYWAVVRGGKGEQGEPGVGMGVSYIWLAKGATTYKAYGSELPYTLDPVSNRARLEFKSANPDERFHTTQDPASWWESGANADMDATGAPPVATDRVRFKPPAGTWKFSLPFRASAAGDDFGIGLFEVVSGTDDALHVADIGKLVTTFVATDQSSGRIESDEVVTDGTRRFYFLGNWDTQAELNYYLRAEKVT